MVSELSSALPEPGGYYAWVKRALGPFWGFQEAWLSLVASIFDMAIYPTLFTLYLARLWPGFGEGAQPTLVGVAVLAVCTALNLRRREGGGPVVDPVHLGCSWPFRHRDRGHLRSSPLRPVSQRRRDLTCSAAFSSRCGITWAGTTPRPSRAKSSDPTEPTHWP